jgi:hypothetical protein
MTGVPRELTLLTGLQSLELSFASYVQTALLPDLTPLNQLVSLTINGELREMPTPLPESLSTLVIRSNSMRVLPDAPARRFLSNSFMGDLKHAYNSSCSLNYDRYLEERYLGLDPSGFSDIPFFIWFRDSCNLPHIPLFDLVEPVMHLLARLTGKYSTLLENLLAIPLGLSLPALAAIGLLATALNLLIFSVNLFLNYAVEPIITFFRDQLGYSRMVHIRDFPAAPQP